MAKKAIFPHAEIFRGGRHPERALPPRSRPGSSTTLLLFPQFLLGFPCVTIVFFAMASAELITAAATAFLPSGVTAWLGTAFASFLVGACCCGYFCL